MLKIILSVGLFGFIGQVVALDVKITADKDFVEVIHQDKLIKVQRIQDQDHLLEGGFAKTSRKCPPFCIQPIVAAEGVTTLGQVEVINFMENEMLDGEGLLVDARTPSWWQRGTIPGSVNIPFTIFSMDKKDPELVKAMKALGVRQRGETGVFSNVMESLGLLGEVNKDWDFSHAKKVVLWCNGMWCGQSPRAIKGLISHGFPANKVFYYRGGMQAWQSLGLTVIEPK